MKAGQSKWNVNDKVCIINQKGDDIHLNGLTGKATHPFPSGCTDKGWIGVWLDKDCEPNATCNVKEDEVKSTQGFIKSITIKNVDIELLKKQKKCLIIASMSTFDGFHDVLDEVIQLLDTIEHEAEKQVIIRTVKGEPLYEGDSYYIVDSNLKHSQKTISWGTEKDIKTLARFLTEEEAIEFIEDHKPKIKK